MHVFRIPLLLALSLVLSWPALGALKSPTADAQAWVLIDQASGRELASKNADVQLASASLTKLMTAYVLFGDLRNKKLALTASVAVNGDALKTDGATVFLSAGETITVDQLLQAMLVQSASDATLALIGASAASPVRMNEAARQLEMSRTRFANPVGLDQPGQLTTAHDQALLVRALQTQYPEFLYYFSQKEFVHKGITFYNSNRLLWLDARVDGMKTGRSPRAGYCLAASETRGDQRRIALLLGAPSDNQRTQGALNLLNFGFVNYDSVRLYRAGQTVKTLRLYRGTSDSVRAGFAQDLYLLVPRGAASRIKASIQTRQPVVAPLRKSQHLGTLRLTLDGTVLGDYPLVALHDVPVANLFWRGWDSLKLMLGR
jgi:D-alanyl-D-alanine carboxypeptidase (penicillin-binding protein 5/6)